MASENVQNRKNPGIIWSKGKHNVFVNNKPATVHVPSNTIIPTYDMLKQHISKSGGIKLGLDHIPQDVLDDYPILSKLNPLDVGMITEIETDGKKIYAVHSQHSNPLIKSLQENNQLPAYSIVADFTSHQCPSNPQEYIVDEITNLERVDYVDIGGCEDCKTGSELDNITITAKLNSIQMEEFIMSNKTELRKIKSAAAEEPDPSESAPEEKDKEKGKEDGGGLAAIADQLEQIMAELGVLQETVEGVVSGDIEAKHSASSSELKRVFDELTELKVSAKRADIEPIVNTAIKEGRILPADKDMFITQGISSEDIESFKTILAKRPVLVDFAQVSKHMTAQKGERTYEDVKAQLKDMGL